MVSHAVLRLAGFSLGAEPYIDDGLADVDQEEWVARIAPVGLYFVNVFVNGTAILEGLDLRLAVLRRPSSSSALPQGMP